MYGYLVWFTDTPGSWMDGDGVFQKTSDFIRTQGCRCPHVRSGTERYSRDAVEIPDGLQNRAVRRKYEGRIYRNMGLLGERHV